jgi:hypothetical protein
LVQIRPAFVHHHSAERVKKEKWKRKRERRRERRKRREKTAG